MKRPSAVLVNHDIDAVYCAMDAQAFGPLIAALQRTSLYHHPVERFEVTETHISWVLLTGPYAYKIKKPVNLGFVDFSTLERRRFFCHEELRLNRRYAPDWYLDVVAVTGSPSAPSWGGDGPVIEYAVKMRQFPRDAELDRRLIRGDLNLPQMETLARAIFVFHMGAAVASAGSSFGDPQRVREPIAANFASLNQNVRDPADRRLLDALRVWSETAHARLCDVFTSRRSDGCVRECHGDLHLANMAWVEEQPLLFDGIEFSEDLRWIDRMSDAAFLTMDLDARGASHHSCRWLNTYLEWSGDYDGLRVLRYYQVYRALVRAKVIAIRSGQTTAAERERLRDEYRRYLRLAERYTAPSRPVLMMTRGLSGSGKSVVAQALGDAWGAIRVRSDVERKRLHGVPLLARSDSTLNDGLYTPEAGARTYERVAELARIILGAGYSVIVDAAALRRRQRDVFRRVAEGARVPWVILDITAPYDVLRARLLAREHEGRDPSEAGVEVLTRQIETAEPLEMDERPFAVSIDTGGPWDISAIVQQVERVRVGN